MAAIQLSKVLFKDVKVIATAGGWHMKHTHTNTHTHTHTHTQTSHTHTINT